MSARLTIAIAWFGLLAAVPALVIGHSGGSNLNWAANQISSYAARGPNGVWITAAMLLIALSLLFLGISISSECVLGTHPLRQLVSMLFGIAASGLLILAYFQETAMNMAELQKMSFAAIRQQTFHDAGLVLFFYGSTIALAISGVILAFRSDSPARRALGAAIAAAGPAAHAILASSWPKHFGFVGTSAGLKQRVAFLSLWAGALLLLAVLTKKQHRA